MRRPAARVVAKYLLWTLAVVLLMAIIGYFFILPGVFSRQYLSRVEDSAQKLSVIYKKLDKSANEPIFNNPDLSTADKKKNLDVIKALISQTHQQLEGFGNSANDLKQLPKIGPLPGGYTKAIATRQAAQNMISQSNDVLDETAALIAYMDIYIGLRDKLGQQLNSFNTITDFNSQIGNSFAFSAAANSIRSYAAQLRQAQPPIDLKQFQQEALLTLSQAASGFDDVAASLLAGLDARIYPAVAEVEQVTARNDNHDKNLFFDTVANSPTLVDLSNITDKLGQFEMLAG